MITLVGVGHVFKLAWEIKEFIYSRNPDVIAVELDRNKLANLLGRKLAHEVYSREDEETGGTRDPGEKIRPSDSPSGEDANEGGEAPERQVEEEDPPAGSDEEADSSPGSIEVTVSVADAGQVYRTSIRGRGEHEWENQGPTGAGPGTGTASLSGQVSFDYHRIMDENGDVRFNIEDPRAGTIEPFRLRKADVKRLFLDKRKKGVPLKYRLVESIQNRLARENEVMAGDEMLAALESGWVLGRPLALIDMDTQKLLQRIHRQMSFFENLRFYMSIIAGMIKSKRDVTEELFKYEADYTDYMEEFARKFPVLKRELIDNRNMYMARNILKLSQHHENVLAVVGEGHVEGIKNLLLKKVAPEELALKRLFDFEEFKKMRKAQEGRK